MTAQTRFPLLAAGIFGATGVALGAFGAHGLQAVLVERGTAQAWESAARYQLVHAVALLGVAAWLRAGGGAGTVRMLWAARFWSAGIVLFSGSLYLLAWTGQPVIALITPAGGLAFIMGWLALGLAGLKLEER